MRVIAALVLLALNLWAQTAIVSGTITRRNGDPAFNVTVTVAGRHQLTDVRGRFRITGVPYGRQSMQVHEGKKILLEIPLDVDRPSVVRNERLP